MRKLQVALVAAIGLALLIASVALAQPANSEATCSVSATVDGIMEWAGNFAAIDVGTMTAQGQVLTGSETQTLYTNGNCTITADTSNTAELSVGAATLYTEYGLDYDVGDTTGTDVGYTVYSAFLSGGSLVTHVAGDGAVDVTLQARATNAAGALADAGAYVATQKLTAAWGP